MRNVARLIAAGTTSLLLVGLAPGMAWATTTPVLTPDNGTTVKPPSTISMKQPGAVFLPLTSTMTVKHGSATVTCPVTVNQDTISCTPSSTLVDGPYDVTYDGETGTHTYTNTTPCTASASVDCNAAWAFTVDGTAPTLTNLTVSPSPYTASSPGLTVTGTTSDTGSPVDVTLTPPVAGKSAPKVTVPTTAFSGNTFTATFTAADLADVADGTVTATASSTDATGNTGTATKTFAKDVVAPGVTSSTPADGTSEKALTGSTPNGLTLVATESLNTASDSGADATITIKDSTDTTIVTSTSFSTTTSANDTIKATPSQALVNGQTYTATVTLRDLVGNTTTVTRTFTVDDSAPAAPVLTPAPAPINATNKAAYSVSGTGEPGATISVTLTGSGPNHVTGSATVNGGGAWTVSGLDTTTLVDGTVTVTATQTDYAGNVSGTATASTTKDTAVPLAPADVSASPSPYDYTVPAATNLTVTGHAAVADRSASNLVADVTLSDTATHTISATGVPVATQTGTFTTAFTPAQLNGLTDGTITVSAVVRDPAGNIGPATTTTFKLDLHRLAVDSAVPTMNGSVQSASDLTLTFNEAVVTNTNNSSPPYTSVSVTNTLGSAVAGTITFNGKVVTFTPSGSFTDAASPYTVTVHSVDAGNSADTYDKTYTFSIDHTAPAAPVVSTVTNPVNSANQTSVAVAGTAERGASVLVTIMDTSTPANTVTKTVTADASTGDFTATGMSVSDLAEGTLSVTAVATDGAGNSGPASSPAVLITKDTVVPGAPTVLTVTKPVNKANKSAVSVTGTAENGASVLVRITDASTPVKAVTKTVTADGATGAFTASLIDVTTLADGALSVTATATDAALNTGPVSAPLTTTKDTVAPSTTVTSVTNPVNKLNQGSVEVDGTTEPGSSMTVTVTDGTNTVSLSGITADNAGAFAAKGIDVTTLADGTLSATAVATDPAGNLGTASAPRTTTKDTGTPATPTISSVTNPVNKANQTMVVVAGTAEKGASVLVTLSDASTPAKSVPKTVTADSSTGHYTATLDATTLADGALTATAVATDAAGNPSTPSTPVSSQKDTVAPSASSLAATGSTTASPNSTVSGQLSESGCTVALSATNGSTTVQGTATVTATSFSGSINLSGFPTGNVAISVKVTDAAGNATTTSVNAARDASTKPAIPAAPKVLAGDRKVTISFTAPADGGAPITIYHVVSTPAGVDVTVSSPVTITAAASNGVDYTFTVTATNRNGSSTSPASAVVTPLGISTSVLNAVPSKIVYGSTVTLSGTVRRTDASAPYDLLAIVVVNDAHQSRILKYLLPSSTGTWSLAYKPSTNLTYYAVYGGDDVNDGAVSVARRTLVAARVTASAPSGSHLVNQVITGGVSPNKAGRYVYLYRVTSTGSLVRLATAKLTSTSTYRFSVRLPKGYTTLVAYIGATPNNAAGYKRFRANRT